MKWIALSVVGLALLAGCQTTQTSVMTADDISDTTAEMAASLKQSAFLRGRTPDSPKAVVLISKVENLTSDIIPVPEQWMIMAQIQGSMPLGSLRESQNVVFVLPPERIAAARRVGYQEEFGGGERPTHLLSATFRSNTRFQRDGDGYVKSRVDLYLLGFELTEFGSRDIVWSDSFDFKREAVGDIKN
jgi:hypothetical protein